MAELFHSDKNENGEDVVQRIYFDRWFYNSVEDQIAALEKSSTLYVGNLDTSTSEQQLHHFFSRAGPVERIIMGLNKETFMPCGFCFVEFCYPEHAGIALKVLNQTCCNGIIDRRSIDKDEEKGRLRLEVRTFERDKCKRTLTLALHRLILRNLYLVFIYALYIQIHLMRCILYHNTLFFPV